MPDQTPSTPPIACTLRAGDFKERMAWIAELNEAALVGATTRTAPRDTLSE
jgi:hypothetical protein